jgi:Na+/H+-dicarboxylate symporter
MQALQMIVIPLVVTHLLAAFIRPSDAAPIGSLGGKTLFLFITMSVGTSLVVWFVVGQTLGFFEVQEGVIESLQSQVIPPAVRDAGALSGGNIGDWITEIIPRNPLQAAIDGNIIQILVFTIMIGLAMGRLPGEQRDPLARVVRSLAEAILILVSWIMWGMPVGVFSLMLSLTLGAGLSVVGLVGLYLVFVTVVMLFITGLVYPVATILGRAGLVRFAKAALPAQIVAATTQSSLASLPALVEGGQKHLDLSDAATGFVLPLCVSVFKLNQATSSLTKALFLAYFLGVNLTLGDILFFMAASIALGLASPGIPRGSGAALKLPLYLAIGIPIEGYVMMEPVKHMPIFDGAATVLNVTGDMGAATILTRADRGGNG